MMFRRLSALLSIVLGALALGGCTTAPKAGEIVISVKAIKPAGDGLVVTLRYINENAVPFAISQSEHTLSLAQGGSVRLVSKEAVGVPQLGLATQDIAVPAADVARLRAATTSGADAPYALASRLTFIIGEDTVIAKSHYRGNLPVLTGSDR